MPYIRDLALNPTYDYDSSECGAPDPTCDQATPRGIPKMVSKKFSYRGLGKVKQLYFQFIGIVGISLFTAFSFGFFAAATNGPGAVSNHNLIEDPRVTPICFGVIFLFVAWSVGSAFINLLPTVWTDEGGITISTFLFFRKFIPWNDLVDIALIHSPFQYFIVKARKITISHQLIGWIYSRAFFPSFLIAKEIENRDELFWMIRNNIAQPK